MTDQFTKDIESGLSSTPKTLSSKYFYDEIGDELFVKIMHMPEYYLTRSELEIFQQKKSEMVAKLGLTPHTTFELVELGAGDGTKTKELLHLLVDEHYKFSYVPVDISEHALSNLEQNLSDEIPTLTVETKRGDYFDVLESLNSTKVPKVVLFLGSNIGNLTDQKASQFMEKLGTSLNPNDMVLLGVDLIKSEEIVLPAYNDASGITRDFNLNLLRRINNELGGNFQLEQFSHKPEYTENEGIAKSFIQSNVDQAVTLESTGNTYEFKAGEKVQTEISRKYNDDILQNVLANSALEIIDKLTDSKGYFADYILRRR